jgi:uncharacterized repeat protein (TIGR01451 family)
MPRQRSGRFHRTARLAVAVLAAALAALTALSIASPAGATPTPGTIRLLDRGPSLGHPVTIAAAGGGTFTATPGRSTAVITPQGGVSSQEITWCVDRTRRIVPGVDYPVDLQSASDAPDLAGPAMLEAAWLMGRADSLIAASATPGLEAAAIQVAVWQLSGQAADVTNVTSDAALNTRAAQLRALARGQRPVTALAISGPSAAVAPGSPATLALTGTPGAEVDLSATGGATLSATRVVLDASGAGQVTATATAAGAVVVTARATGGSLARAIHIPGRSDVQDMAWVTPAPVTATATLTVAAPVVQQQAPVPVAPVKPLATLRLVKQAPASVLRGARIDYALTVTNVSKHTARGVVVRDPLPAGTFVRLLPARARLRAGAVVWHLGALAPGHSVTVHLRLGTAVKTSGPVTNVATARASNARLVRARAQTVLRSAPRVLPERVVPVTG